MQFARVQCQACRSVVPENMAVKCVVTTVNNESLVGCVDNKRRVITPGVFCPGCLPKAVAAAVDTRERSRYHSAEGDAPMTTTIDDLRQHQLVILRRLRNGPLTEFELSSEVAGHSGWEAEQASDMIGQWLGELASSGLIQVQTGGVEYKYKTATLTGAGREVVG